MTSEHTADNPSSIAGGGSVPLASMTDDEFAQLAERALQHSEKHWAKHGTDSGSRARLWQIGENNLLRYPHTLPNAKLIASREKQSQENELDETEIDIPIPTQEKGYTHNEN